MTSVIQYVIRRFDPADLQRVVNINQACLPENYPDSFFLLIYSSFPEGFLVAESTGDVRKEIAGYTMNRIEVGVSNFSKNPLRRVKKGHVISIAVLPHARKQKLAWRLMIKALEEMSNKGAEECFLEVRESNEPAITLYERMGFERSKLLKRYYSDNENAYQMTIKLPQSEGIFELY